MASRPLQRGAAIRLEGVERTFPMGDVLVSALVDIDLTFAAGTFVVILGPSGSGKSTLLNLIGGMDRPTAGRMCYGAEDLTEASDAALTEYRRRRVGFIFQFYNLVPTLTALENVQVATELVDDPMDATAALTAVGLGNRLMHFPAQLSGGEQQRVAIARALAKRPELLLADEPTGALDLATARGVLGILQELNRSQDLTLILITHNPALTAMADRVIRLVSGRVAEDRLNAEPQAAATIAW